MKSRRHFMKSAGWLTAAAFLQQSFTNVIDEQPLQSILKPKRLKVGDTIAITSPAGAVWEEAQVEKFSSILSGFGFKVVLGKTLSKKSGYFAGTDDERANELNELFFNKEIKGIFCMKGGWGCARILDKLNYQTIKENPKVLIGFSDITTLLNAIYAKTGLVTFHGPVHILPLNIPAYYGAMIGHIENKLTIPVGIDANMNADSGTLILNETAVS